MAKKQIKKKFNIKLKKLVGKPKQKIQKPRVLKSLKDEPDRNLENPKLNFLRDVSVIVVGKNTGPVIDLLFNKTNVNEFLIAERLELTINQARNILYKLSDKGLVSFIRKKDKKKGWYTYFWTLNDEKALLLLKDITKKEIDQFEHQLKSRQVKQFYFCKTCSYELTEEKAMVHNFTCPECGEVYELKDNKNAINELNSQLNKLKRRLHGINNEVRIIDEYRAKMKEKEIRKIQREKEKKKKDKQQQRAKLKKAEKNKLLKNSKKPKESKKKAKTKLKSKKKLSKKDKKLKKSKKSKKKLLKKKTKKSLLARPGVAKLKSKKPKKIKKR